MTLVEFLLARLAEDAEHVGPDASRSDDIDLKRQIVTKCDSIFDGSAWDLTQEILRLLAAAYDWHPDYDEAWRP